MLVSIIAAMDHQGLIGQALGLPWHLPSDLRRFRAHTLGKPVIMGRRTFESIGKPLPERLNIVLTHDPVYRAPGCQVARTLPEGLSLAEAHLASTGKDEAMVIGGGQVYQQAIERWDRLYLTIVHGQFHGTTYFPLQRLLGQKWRPRCEPESYPADARNPYAHSFHIIERAWDEERVSPGAEACADLKPVLDEQDLLALLTRGTLSS